ncbi:MAG: SDR family NAD(P)-dependent oxidoreductase [Acidimicrobiia bacterium]|nr:SDR family NAD(P)-dependent oxidoreductase [Acidimicrobiia bacterium]
MTSGLDLDGRVAIVTGAGRGLGRAHALALADAGARVVVNNRSPEAAGAVAAEIRAAGGSSLAHSGDVADWSVAEALVAQAIAEFGDLHILVNNAGITRDRMSFNMTEDEWDDVVRVNLKGHFAPSRFAGTYWREQGTAPGRRIVNTVSEGGLFPARGHANYSAAKAGILGITLELASELAKYGATVNAIAMRARTRMTEAMGFDAPESGLDRYDPAHTSKAVTWLCSDDAADVTGQVLLVVGSRVSVIGPLAVSNRVELSDEWTAADLGAAKSTLFPSGGANVIPSPPG